MLPGMKLRHHALIFVAAFLLTIGVIEAAKAWATSAHPVQDVVTRVAPPGTTVDCVRMTNGDMGRTFEFGDGSFQPYIELSSDTCGALVKLVEHRMTSRWASANALETLLHEAHHLSLVSSDEGRVECAALAAMPFWLNRLGYHGRAATRLLRMAWSVHLGLSNEYQGTCVDPYEHAGPIERP